MTKKLLEKFKEYKLFYTLDGEEEFFFTIENDEWLEGIQDGRFKPSVLIGIKEKVKEYELPERILKKINKIQTKIGEVETNLPLFKNTKLDKEYLIKFIEERINNSIVNDEDTWNITEYSQYTKFEELIESIKNTGKIRIVINLKNENLIKEYGTDLIVIEVWGKKEYNIVAGDGIRGWPYNTKFLGTENWKLKFKVSFSDGHKTNTEYIWKGQVLLRIPEIKKYDILYKRK